ncbi:hypothetical protein, partial [Escherichia coli]|uniref:hypothetical protein n=1 Tax=Escherichia coli TaxID=562 RepID=UPI0020373831
MARQTYFTSATKRPRSLRQILAELFSGRVMSRLDELETTVRLLNERLDNQASVVANVGAIVASGSSREAKNARPLVKEKNNKDSSNGKFSKKEAETNGLRSHYSFTGDGMNRPGFPGECFICELRLPDHYFRWKHNKLFL